MPSGAVKKADWGKAKKSAVAAATPAAQTGSIQADNGGMAKTMPKLEDIDLSKLEFCPPEKRTNDWVTKILYDGEPFQFAFEKLPKMSRMPFVPGLPKKDGLEIGTQMSTRIDMTPEQYDKWLAIENKFIEDMTPHRTKVFPHDPKKGEAACSVEVFRSKMKRKGIPADIEKGYSASLQVRVNHEEGKQPKILTTMLIEEGPHAGKNTQPKPGKFSDLKAKCAGAFQGRIRGGGYFGNFGMGLPVTLEAACIVLNKQGSGGPMLDFSETDFVPESEVPDLVAANGAADENDGEGSAGGGAEDEGSADDEEAPQFGDESKFPPP